MAKTYDSLLYFNMEYDKIKVNLVIKKDDHLAIQTGTTSRDTLIYLRDQITEILERLERQDEVERKLAGE